MKKFFLSLAVLMMGAVSFTSCGDDNDFEDVNLDDIKPQDVKVTTSLKDNGKSLVLTMKAEGIATFTYTATFDDNNLCNSYVEVEDYKYESHANQAWAEYQKDEDAEDYTRQGNKITHKDDSMIGESKEDVKIEFELIKAYVDAHGLEYSN